MGAVIGGIFFLPVFLWVMKYKPAHTYEMETFSGDAPAPANRLVQPKSTQTQTIGTKADKLRELKSLLDEELITQEEYNTERGKIMNADQK